ncbi:hypothetical protein COO60DRAFT_358359 [Scenedesmus sp. NREL 46B-D3]|nr:hypothetical protein COO60DRAFT_358359 [Scenedesmus sp. NREL 46B-D3]
MVIGLQRSQRSVNSALLLLSLPSVGKLRTFPPTLLSFSQAEHDACPRPARECYAYGGGAHSSCSQAGARRPARCLSVGGSCRIRTLWQRACGS